MKLAGGCYGRQSPKPSASRRRRPRWASGWRCRSGWWWCGCCSARYPSTPTSGRLASRAPWRPTLPCLRPSAPATSTPFSASQKSWTSSPTIAPGCCVFPALAHCVRVAGSRCQIYVAGGLFSRYNLTVPPCMPQLSATKTMAVVPQVSSHRPYTLHDRRRRVAEEHEGVFAGDRTLNLIVRLRHNVIRAGLRRINLAYSRISLADIAAKLGAPLFQNPHETEGHMRCGSVVFIYLNIHLFAQDCRAQRIPRASSPRRSGLCYITAFMSSAVLRECKVCLIG